MLQKEVNAITSNYPVLYNAEQKPYQYLKFSSLTATSAVSGSGNEADEISESFKTWRSTGAQISPLCRIESSLNLTPDLNPN